MHVDTLCLHAGVKPTTMNVHLLMHLPDCVKSWGPLWAYSCFHFENLNGYLKFLFHGTRDMTKQVYTMLCSFFGITSCYCFSADGIFIHSDAGTATNPTHL